MAFSKLYDKPWFKRPFPNMRYYYKKKLYDDWYNSLTDEQREYLKQKEEKEKRESEKYLDALLDAYGHIMSKCGYYADFGRFSRIFKD